jgi:hypothetical protein
MVFTEDDLMDLQGDIDSTLDHVGHPVFRWGGAG